MPVKPELKTWMDSLPLSEETKKLLAGDLEKDEVQKVVSETVMARSDYSRKLDENKTLQTQLENDRKATNDERTAVTRWKQEEEARVKKWHADNQAALAKEANQKKAYEAKLAKMVSDGWITPEEAQISNADFIANQPITQSQPVDRDGRGRFVSPDDLIAANAETRNMSVHAIAKINDLADQHFDLFGTRMNRQELVDLTLQMAEDARVNRRAIPKVEDVWRVHYKVDEKREEVRQAKIDLDKKAFAEEAVIRDRSERALAGDNAPYTKLDDKAGNQHLLGLLSNSKDGSARAMGVSPTVAKAVEAYRSGKLGSGTSTG